MFTKFKNRHFCKVLKISFIHFCVLKFFYVAGIVLGSRDTEVMKIDNISFLLGVTF